MTTEEPREGFVFSLFYVIFMTAWIALLGAAILFCVALISYAIHTGWNWT